MDSKRDIAKELEMVSLFKQGKTLQDIGDVYSMTRERVRQLIARHGVKKSDGGWSKARFEKYGCSKEEFEEIERKLPKCLTRWNEQKASAKSRGIKWNLTFKEWASVWDGHWEKRGRGHGMVMCRKKDQGAYEIGNVFVAPGSFNNSAYQIRKWHGVDIDAVDYFTA